MIRRWILRFLTCGGAVSLGILPTRCEADVLRFVTPLLLN